MAVLDAEALGGGDWVEPRETCSRWIDYDSY